MRFWRAVIAVLTLTSVGGTARQSADAAPLRRASSLTLFPSELVLQVRRGEVIERTIGITQSGAPERVLRIEVLGEAAPFVTIVDAADRITPVASVRAAESVPAYVVVRIAPGDGVPEGTAVARVRFVANGGSVAVGSELRVEADVRGTSRLDASLLDARAVAPQIEAGRLLRVQLRVDVRGEGPFLPEVRLELRGPDGPVPPLTALPAALQPGGVRIVDLAWPTTDWPLGRYEGQMALSSGTTEIGRATLGLDVVPLGTLTPEVTLLAARVEGTPRAGRPVKVVVSVRNDGELDGRVVFAGELLRDGTPLAPVRSEPRLLSPDETAELAVYADLPEGGAYRLRGRANLEGTESSAIALDIEATGGGGLPVVPIAAAAAAGGAVAAAVLVVRRGCRRRRRLRAVKVTPKRQAGGVALKPRRAS